MEKILLPVTRMILVRHGESEHNSKELIQGQIDSKLTDKGRKQAKELGEKLSDQDFDPVYSSDLERAVETAEILKQDSDAEIIQKERLRERHLGDLQGKHYSQWDQVEIDTDNHSWRPENGESLKEHKKRVSEVLGEIKDSGAENVLVVAHGGSIRAAIFSILGCETRRAWRFSIDNCSITELSYEDDRWLIEKVGCSC